MMETWFIQTGILLLVAIIGYQLRKKDAEQSKALELLFKLHDKDAARLNDFELRIAQNHYIKPELDSKFNEMKTTIKESMDTLGSKFDKLSDILISHMLNERDKQKDGN